MAFAGGGGGGADDFPEAPAAAARPVQLIAVDPATGDLTACRDGLACLRAIREPVGVIAVCGRARTGKSYVLNQLLGRSTGFKLAHSHRPCTKGLWLWSQPIAMTGPDGNAYKLLLLDSEGIDAYDQRAQDAVQLLSLAVLLSSTFVFNQMGAIDEAAIDRLGLVAQVARHVRVRAGGPAAEDAAELRAFTPAFVWLLRDFYLDLQATNDGDEHGDDAAASSEEEEDGRGGRAADAADAAEVEVDSIGGSSSGEDGDGEGQQQHQQQRRPRYGASSSSRRQQQQRQQQQRRRRRAAARPSLAAAIGPREYLEAALAPAGGSSGGGGGDGAKDAIRAAIKQLFPDRDCFTLVRPMHDEKALNRLDALDPREVRPEFQAGVRRLTQALLARAQPKRIGVAVVTGPVLAGLAQAYVDAINGGAVPTIATAWQGVAEQECRRAAAAGEEAYARAFDGGDAGRRAAAEADPEALLLEHLRCVGVAKAAFKAIAVAEPRARGAAKASMLAALERRYAHAREAALARASGGVDRALVAASQRIANAARGSRSWAGVQGEIAAAVADFDAATAGPTKWPRLTAFLREQYGAIVEHFVRLCEADAERKAEAARAAAREAEWRLKAAESSARKAEVRVADLASAEEMLRRELLLERERRSLGGGGGSSGGGGGFVGGCLPCVSGGGALSPRL